MFFHLPSPLRRPLAWAMFLLVLDQLSKGWILRRYPLEGMGDAVTSFFNLVRVHNHGAAFSFLSDAGGWQRWFFTGLALAVSAWLIAVLRKGEGSKAFRMALTLVLAGALGNAVDRLVHGYVVDFLDFHLAWLENWFYQGHYPAFNIADSCITVGAMLMLIDAVRHPGDQAHAPGLGSAHTSGPSLSPLTATSGSPRIHTLAWQAPLQWLHLGWRDALRCGPWSWAHGATLALGGMGLALLAAHRFWLLAGSLSGFLVIAPVLATSLYAMSRALEKQQRVNGRLLYNTWLGWHAHHRNNRAGYWSMVRFGLLLALAATGWVLVSAALITLFAPQPVQTPLDFLHHVVVAPNSWLFEAWLFLGGILAAPIFASSVVAIPLLLERQVGVKQAVLTSWQVVLANPGPMALWAALLMLLTLLGIVTAFLGLVIVIPVLGHASWHAYRATVDTSAWPLRLPPPA